MKIRFFAILLLLTIIGCGGGDKSPELASVNGKSITESEFGAYLTFRRIPEKNTVKSEKFLDEYLEREALASVIETEALLDKKMTDAELNEFRKEMLISRYFENYLLEKVSDQAVENYYNTHGGDYEQEKAHAAHILIRTNAKMSEVERKTKLTTAQEAYSKIRSGEDFGEIAGLYSEDRVSGAKQGDLGWLKKGSINRKFSDTLFELKTGEVSEPFETPFGFHVVKLIEEPRTIRQPFGSVAGNIRYQLRSRMKQDEMKRLISMGDIKKNKR